MAINGELIVDMVLQIILIQTGQQLVLLLKTLHYGVIGEMMELVNIIQIQLQVKITVYIVLIVI